MENAGELTGSVPVSRVFEKILANNLERLIGTRYGIGGLPLTFSTIFFLITLAECEEDIEKASSTPPDRYTPGTLVAALDEIGLKANGASEDPIKEIIEKGYVEVVDGNLVPKKPAITTARLINHLFRGMSGISLVAYFAQTLEEVLSGRKAIEEGSSQFDQVLRMKGVSLSKKESRPEPGNKTRQQEQLQTAGHRPGNIIPPKAPPKASEGKKAEAWTSQGGSAPVRAVREFDFSNLNAGKNFKDNKSQIGSESVKGKTQVEEKPKEVSWKTPFTPSPQNVVNSQKEKTPEPVGRERPATEVPSNTSEDTCLADRVPPASRLPEEKSKPSVQTPISLESPSIPEEAEAAREHSDGLSAVNDGNTDVADAYVEKRIAAFEEELMNCPLCVSGKVEVKRTVKEKSFYVCSNEKCKFISWGKPYFFSCPLCKNPFLIEANDVAGRVFLKCPRATCLHRQSFPGPLASDIGYNEAAGMPDTAKPAISAAPPRKKVVVRKRLVRKKR